ncbi:hypothetical protein ACHAW6_005626 [Cyclotella cf. meneghiniana]
MGQFLGYLRQYLSTVVLVQNLHTGYVSPQYHVVIDNKFQPVFHDGKSTEELDNICDSLFADSCECYVEEEFDDDGMLIYRLPPLDEVWLSKLEQCKRRIELDKQQNNITHVKQDLEATEVKQRLERSRESPPDLVDTDAESSDDGSVSSLPDYDPGGDGRDLWAQEEAELPAPEPPDIANKSPFLSKITYTNHISAFAISRGSWHYTSSSGRGHACWP